MRILVVGAGAIGGYFGGRLLGAGRDVTFLVRERRATKLAETGLIIKSAFGDVELPSPPVVSAETIETPFDLIILSCKAYDLDGALDSLAPAVASDTAILPLLNGLRHIDAIKDRFGEAALGGQCFISTDLDPDGAILHHNDRHTLVFGELAGGRSERTERIAAEMQGATLDPKLSENIVHSMWDKWVFLATFAGITCLMRAPIGDIVAAGGADLALAMLEESRAIAKAAGYPTEPAFWEQSRATLTAEGSTMVASMLRDVERGARTEVDHIIGDLLARRGTSPEPDHSLLRLACTHLKAYEAREGGRRPLDYM